MDVAGPLGIGPLDEGVNEADGGGGLPRVRRSCTIWAGTTSLLLPASRFISSMTRAVPPLPYRRLMACSTALRVAIMGMMRLREAVLTSS